METGRQAMLAAFDRLFAKTADKMGVAYTPEDLREATDAFAERMSKVFDALETVPVDSIPAEAVEKMMAAIDEFSPAQIVGQLATLPLVQYSQLMLQQLAYRAAEQRFLESAMAQADTTYGGN